jgi:hypothetical protein
VPWRWHRPVPVVSMASQRRRQGSALPSIMGCDAGHDRHAGGSGPTTSPEQRSRHRVPRRRQSGAGDAALEIRAARSDLGEGDYAAVGAGPLEPPVHAHTVRPTRLRLQPKRDNAGTGAKSPDSPESAGERWRAVAADCRPRGLLGRHRVHLPRGSAVQALRRLRPLRARPNPGADRCLGPRR